MLSLRERTGNYQVAVFVSPTPLRAGPVDVSMLVQHAGTGEYVTDVRVSVRIARADTDAAPLEFLATTEAATNKHSKPRSSTCPMLGGGQWRFASTDRTG
jgi:hypothetical protein